MSTRTRARSVFFFFKTLSTSKCYPSKNCVALLSWFRVYHSDGYVSSNVSYVTVSHRTYCHAAGLRLVEFSVSKWLELTFLPHSLIKNSNFTIGNLQKVQKKKPLGLKCLLLCVSILEVFTQLHDALAYHENSWTSTASYRDFLQ